jgi:hypothetical protein
VIALPTIQFDRGVLEGANAWERLAALAWSSGSKEASSFSHRGYNSCANLLRKRLPERDIAIRLNPEVTFEFPNPCGLQRFRLRQRVLAKPDQRPERKCRAPHAMRD